MNLEKIYIEPTNFCNLSCKTCIRNTWKHDFKELTVEDFEHLVKDLQKIKTLKTIMLSGFGEPLYHKGIVKIIKMFKQLKIRVEMISNGILLDEEMCVDLIKSGLDMIWVSIDGASAKKYEKIRLGGSQDTLINNLLMLNRKRALYKSPLKLGISFVAMKDNIDELPDVVSLARRLRAKDIKVTNVLPYTEDMVEKTLYNRLLTMQGGESDLYKINIDLPSMDIDNNTKEPLFSLARGLNKLSIMGDTIIRKSDYCKFIKEGCMVIGADGRVAPCLALLYENKTYLHGYQRTIKPVSYGNIKKKSIIDIWDDEEYSSFRKKVDEFDFSICTYCGGCDYLESNEEDCFGNQFPVCGGCLWAQGIIQCP